MSKSRRDVVARYVAALQRGDLNALRASVTPEATWTIRGDVPVAGGGAREISLAGKDHVGVAGGSVFTTPGWKPHAAGFDVDATAGAARVALTARAS